MKKAARQQRYWADERWASRYNRTHFVYRAYGANGDLLYVGCTSDIAARAKAHRYQSDWYAKAIHFAVSGPYFRADAYRKERELIAALRPAHNVRGVA